MQPMVAVLEQAVVKLQKLIFNKSVFSPHRVRNYSDRHTESLGKICRIFSGIVIIMIKSVASKNSRFVVVSQHGLTGQQHSASPTTA